MDGTACFDKSRSYFAVASPGFDPADDDASEVAVAESFVDADAEDDGDDEEEEGALFSYTLSNSLLASGTIRPWSRRAWRYCDERQAL
jgi:hypothetical protein